MRNFQYAKSDDNNGEKWYESLWGIVILALGVNLFSNWLYNRGVKQLRQKDRLSERKREQKHLKDYHGEHKSLQDIEDIEASLEL